MKDITLSDIPCLKDYEEVKKRLFVRLWNKERLQENGTIYEPFQDLYFSCHIDVSDLAGATAFCMVKERYAECLGVDRKQLLADAVENGTRIRPALTMPIEAYMARMGAPVDAEPENHLMIATTEDFLYGASVVMYPGFLERISGGKNLYLIPSRKSEGRACSFLRFRWARRNTISSYPPITKRSTETIFPLSTEKRPVPIRGVCRRAFSANGQRPTVCRQS